MDADRFDAFARALDGGSRRRFLASLSGVALGALAPLLGLADVEGKKRKRKKKKKKKKKPPEYCRDFGGWCGSKWCCWGTGQHCCVNKKKGTKVCCQSNQGCASSGLCEEPTCGVGKKPCLGADGLTKCCYNSEYCCHYYGSDQSASCHAEPQPCEGYDG